MGTRGGNIHAPRQQGNILIRFATSTQWNTGHNFKIVIILELTLKNEHYRLHYQGNKKEEKMVCTP